MAEKLILPLLQRQSQALSLFLKQLATLKRVLYDKTKKQVKIENDTNGLFFIEKAFNNCISSVRIFAKCAAVSTTTITSFYSYLGSGTVINGKPYFFLYLSKALNPLPLSISSLYSQQIFIEYLTCACFQDSKIRYYFNTI